MMNRLRIKQPPWRHILALALLALAPCTAHAVTGTPVGVIGSTGSTDNAILRADGTGGATVQSSGLLINDSGHLQFGGATSSFPALKRNSAILEARLADDSDYAAIQASSVRVPSLGQFIVTQHGASITGNRSLVFNDTGGGGIDSSNTVTIIDTNIGDGTTKKVTLTPGQSY